MGTEKNFLNESFEHPKHKFDLMDKKIIVISRGFFLLNWPYVMIMNKLPFYTR